MLNFHAKLGLETLQSGASGPPLGRSAWGSCHVATDLQTVALITSWRWLAVGLASILQLLGRLAYGRPAGLPLAHLGLKLGRGLVLLVDTLQGSGFSEFLYFWAVLWTFG